jgi:penicillin-binding protein 1A
VTTATVCRLSGKLAAEGCTHVDVVNANGSIEQRSMVYTEYFAKGTAPSAYCDLHPTRGLMGKFASIFSGNAKPIPPPPHVEDTGIQTAPVVVTAAAAAAASADHTTAAPPEAAKKKRGFWGRLFGRRGPDEKSDREKSDRTAR